MQTHADAVTRAQMYADTRRCGHKPTQRQTQMHMDAHRRKHKRTHANANAHADKIDFA